MKTRLLTSHEESIMKAYVERGVKLQGFSVLKHRLLNQNLKASDFKKLREQTSLLYSFLKTVEE